MSPRPLLGHASACAVLAALATPARGQSAPDLPRDHPGYELLETLDTVGRLDSRLSTTRGLTRTEVARLVLEAADATPRGDNFDAIEARVRLLASELAAELEVLRGGEAELTQAYWKPLERATWMAAQRGGPRPPDGLQGRTVVRGGQWFGRFETHGAWGPFAFALEPEWRHWPDDFGPAEDESESRGRLLRGYARLGVAGVDLTAGRLTPEWGPWHPRGGDGLVFGANAAGFPGVSLRTSEPVLLPWIFSAVGPVGWEAFVGRLERGAPIPEALLGGLRVMWRPWPFLETALHRAFMFGGDDRPLNPGLMLSGLHDNRDGPSNRDLANQLGGGDVRLRVAMPGGMGAVAYGEFFGEDEAGGLPSKWSHRIGLHVAGIPPWRGVEVRVEYAQLHRAAYRHGTYTGGWNYRGAPLGHHVGGGASDVSGEVVLTPWWPARWGLVQLRGWGSLEIRGRRNRPGFPGEEHRQLGLEVAWQSVEGVRVTLSGWWLTIHRVGGVHGLDDEGAYLAVSTEVRF